MLAFITLLLFITIIALFRKVDQNKKLKQNIEEQLTKEFELLYTQQELQQEILSLSQYREIRDLKLAEEEAVSEIQKLQEEALKIELASKQNAEEIISEGKAAARLKQKEIEALLKQAHIQANQIIVIANDEAKIIAGNAYEALTKANQLEDAIKAMKNVIKGYGDEYLKPTYSLLDELAETYSFDEAGQELKKAREHSQLMTENGRAAHCEYAEPRRRETAIRFVLDAFNGKVDSTLSRSKIDNYGILEQKIRDAFALVNNNGSAFRDAQIKVEYLNSRLMELKWLIAVNVLKEKEKEEQRQIREQIREEEKARKEIERALKDAAKEEELLQKALEKVRLQVEKASEEQRAAFEAQLEELQDKLILAEERNKRALSMAQQTKAGHVYIISNIGSFGENVYKIGMTRRLEPLDRVRELGDASVPFSFDVHAMIWCEDAPQLENTLHKHFVEAQVNKVNPRKEFFKLPLSQLREVVEEQGVQASWTMAAKAAQYRESLAIEQELSKNSLLASGWLDQQMQLSAETNERLLIEV